MAKQWLWVLVGSWLRPSHPKLTLPPGCRLCGAGGLVQLERLHELLLELKAQLGLRGWGPAAWLFPGGVILPWSFHPCRVTCSWYHSQA